MLRLPPDTGQLGDFCPVYICTKLTFWQLECFSERYQTSGGVDSLVFRQGHPVLSAAPWCLCSVCNMFLSLPGPARMLTSALPLLSSLSLPSLQLVPSKKKKKENMCLFNPCRIWEVPSRRWLSSSPFICCYCGWHPSCRKSYQEIQIHRNDQIASQRNSIRGLRTHQQDELVMWDEYPEQRLQVGNTSPLSAEPGSHVTAWRLRSSRPMFGEFKKSHKTTFESLQQLSSAYLSHFFKFDA